MLQLQSSRNKVLHDWKKQKEPNFLQKNKLALKQNAKQTSLRTNATNKSHANPKETSKKSSVTKPPLKGTSKSSMHHQQQQQQQSNRVTGEDSVVISKSALDNLLKQLVDAKQAASILPPIVGNHQDDRIAPIYQDDNNIMETTMNIQQKAIVPINYTESQRQRQEKQHYSKHKDLDYLDVPGLSSSRPMAPQTTRDSSMGEHSSVPRNMDVGQVYFPFGRPGGGAPNRPYQSTQTDFTQEMSVNNRVDSERHHQLSITVSTSKHSPQDPMNTSPRQHHSDISITHPKSVYLEEWQIREKELKRRKNLEHYEFVRAQITEKERKKEEARQRKALEERQEEERIAKQRAKVQREYQEEQERIRRKEEELARRNALMYQKIQEAKSTALEVKHMSKVSPPFNQNSNISVPAIVEESHYSDYESGTDDPDSRTNLDQVKVRLSFDSALRSPSMCNVIPDNSQGQEQSSSPRKHTVKSKSKSSVQQESVQSKGLEVGRQKKTKHNSTSNTIGSLKEASHVPNKKRERKPSKIPIPTKELLKNTGNEEAVGELKEQKGALKRKEHIKGDSAHTQKGHRVSRNKEEKVSTKRGTLATQRSSSPPVPALAKKLEKTTVNSTANGISQSTDHFLPSLSTHTSKRAQQKAAEKFNSIGEEISTPLANSVARLHQSSLKSHHHEQIKPPVSPPVPALAKKLQQAQSLHKSSMTAGFDSHNRSVLPPISDIGPNGETDLKDTFTPTHNPQHVLSPVAYSSQPVTEFRSNSPPVPALAKQLNQQQSHTLNHIDNPLPVPAGMCLTPKDDCRRSVSPELDSESQFTYLPEMEAQATNHEQNGLQLTQPIMYIPVSAHQFLPDCYSQCSLNGSACFQNSQMCAPQVLSPVQIMVPPFSHSLSQPQHQQANTEQRRESSNATLSDEDVFQPQYTKSESSTTMQLSLQQQYNMNSRDSKLLQLPPVVATATQDKTENEDKDYNPAWSPSSVTTTPQMSQQKEEVLQHLAMMKKRLLAQQQSITKRQLSSSSKSLQRSSNKLPPLL